MTGGTTSLTIPKLKNMEEGLVSPHWLVTTRITPSFPFSKTNLQTSSPCFLCWVFQIFWTKFILNSSLPWQSCSKLFHQDLHRSLLTSYCSRCLQKDSIHSCLYFLPNPSSRAGRACLSTELNFKPGIGSIICLYKFWRILRRAKWVGLGCWSNRMPRSGSIKW